MYSAQTHSLSGVSSGKWSCAGPLGCCWVVALIGRQLSSPSRPFPPSSQKGCLARDIIVINGSDSLSPLALSRTLSRRHGTRFMSNYVADCVKLAGHASTGSTGQRLLVTDCVLFAQMFVQIACRLTNVCLAPADGATTSRDSPPASLLSIVYRVSFIVVWFCFAYDLHEIRFARLRLRGANREREREKECEQGRGSAKSRWVGLR